MYSISPSCKAIRLFKDEFSWDKDQRFWSVSKSRDNWTDNWWQEGDAITVRVRKAIATYDFEG